MMMNYKIVLDAGHGGDDPGATGNGIIEKNLTLDITKYLYDRFNELGIPVKVTRLTDETITPTDRVNRVLNAFGNSKDVIVISSHINAGGGDGAEVIYPLRSSNVLPNLILNEISKEGQNIRKSYQRRLPSDPSKDYYFMQRNTGDTESLTVEYGFLDSPKDDVNQLNNNYKNLAEAVVRAVTSYIGSNYTPVGNDFTYIVKAGDTLYNIAKKYNMTVEKLKDLNNLTNNMLMIGQILKLSQDDKNTNNYIVKKGDTLYSIAKNNGIDINTLKSINGLTSNLLSVGQILVLEPVNESKNIYIVKAGDTLYSIARKNNTDVNTLKALNNLQNNIVSIGMELILPEIETPEKDIIGYNEYVVQNGDTLYSIARRYNKTVDEIKRLNNMTSDLLTVGMKIRI